MSSDGRLRIRCRVTTALCCSLASLAAFAGTPAQAADECGPVPLGGGTIECPTADYPSGISYDAGVEDLTVVVDPGSTLEGPLDLQGLADLAAFANGASIDTSADNQDGVSLDSIVGDLTVAVSDVTTSGANSDGVLAITQDGGIVIGNGIKGRNGTITTYGGGSDGIHAEAGGDIQISSANIETLGTGSDGIEAHSANGGVSIVSSSIDTIGHAIIAEGKYDVLIDSGSIHAAAYGPYGAVDAIHAFSGSGNIGISSGTLETSFDRGIYARADNGSIEVNAGSVHTTGAGGQGMVLFAGNDINVTVEDLTTHSDAFLADGIIAYSGGAISIAAGNVDVYGGHASALLGYAQHGSVDISANDVTLAYNQIWGPAGAGEAITGLARYGDVTIAAHDVYSQGRGIAAEALYGNVSITANNVVAGSQAGYSGGVFAFTLFGDATVDVNDVTTHDQYGITAAVRVEGALNLTFDKVLSTGYVAGGVAAFGGGYTSSVVVTGDSIETDGAVAIGFWGFNYGSGGSTVDINTITTHGVASDGIAFTNDSSFDYYSGEIYYSTLRLHAGKVTTFGDYSDALNLTSHAGDVYARLGDVSTYGERSAGLVLVDTGGHLAPPNGAPIHFFRPGDFDIQANSVETTGDYSTAITGYLQAGELHLDVGSIATHGDYASGVLLSSGVVYFGPPGSQLFDINIGTIETDGKDSNGIIIYGNGAPVDISVDKVTTHGADSSGVVALGLGDVNVTAGSVDLAVADPSDASYYSTGIYAASFGGNVNVAASSITTGGNKSAGIVASANGRVGYYGDVYVGNAVVAADEVSTAGDEATGVSATSIGGDVDIHAGSVETHGDYAIGVSANALAFVASAGTSDHALRGGDLTIVADNVQTSGNHSDGVSALGFSGGDTNVTVGTVETSGDDSYGVNVVTSGQTDDFTGQFYGGSTTVAVDKVTTSGVGANGVRVFAFTGDVDLTVGSADVTGESSDAVIGANGSDGSVVVNILDHAVSTQGFGVVASAYDDVTVNLADHGRISGGSVGVYADGLQNIDVNVGDGAQVSGGAIGVQAGAENDTASARVTNLGEIATSASGIAIMASAHDVTIDNSGALIGPVSLTDRIGLIENSGLWQSFGTSTFGFGDDTISNSGRMMIGLGNAGEHTSFTGLETLDNFGLITMADGHADQVLNLDRATFVGDTGSKLAIDIDANAHGLTSDLIELGVASGATELQLNGHGGLGTTLVVDANASSGAGNFFLPGGGVDLGFVRMSLDYNAAKSNWSLVGAPDQEALEGTRFADQAQSLWRRGIDVWSQTLDEAPTPERFTVWGRYLAGHEDQDLSPAFNVLGSSYTPSLDTDARWDGAVLGASLGRGAWSWGALAGITSQTTRFTFDDNKLRSKGTSFGAYAAWNGTNMFARAIADYQHVRVRADLPTAGVSDALHGSVAGVRGEMGLNLPLGAMALRPMVSASWTRGHLGDLTAPGATIDFHSFSSLEVSAGASLSGATHVGTTTLHPYAGIYGVKEFRGRNSLDLDVGSQSLRLVGQPQNDHAKATAGFAADLGGAFRLSVGGEAEFLGGRSSLKGQIGLSWHG